MKAVGLILVSLAALSASAGFARPPLVEQDSYERGSLAVAAIDRGDWKTAETLLIEHKGVSADDPARLINLGRVYMETGRPGMALTAWRAAASSRQAFDIETGDGRVVSSRQLAQELVSRYQPSFQTTARN